MVINQNITMKVLFAGITGIMLLNGTEVELSEISAKSGNSSLNDSFLFGWKVTFLVLSLVTLIGLFASIKVKSKV